MEERHAALVREARYPVRPYAVLTPEQLAATRAQLGPAAFVAPKKPRRREEDRHPLTAEEVCRARALAGTR